MEKAFGETPARIQKITDLICDPWQIEKYDAKRAEILYRTAELLVQRKEEFSKDMTREMGKVVAETRGDVQEAIDMTYYMAGEGRRLFGQTTPSELPNKFALHHNMQPTTLIQSCRHALAIDEHRSSFSQTPFVAYTWDTNRQKRGRKSRAAEIPQHYEVGTDVIWKQDWQRIRAMEAQDRAALVCGGAFEYRRRLSRQPAGAASVSVGAGGCKEVGLSCEELPPVAALAKPLPQPRDSFAEFARPFWMNLFRAKRYYRPIDPAPELRASPKKEDGTTSAGFALENINEQVDSSVFEYWANEHRPPNLAEYARRRLGESPGAPANNPPHLWLGDDQRAHCSRFMGCAGSMGVAAMKEFVIAQHGASATLSGGSRLWPLDSPSWTGRKQVSFSIAQVRRARGGGPSRFDFWSRATGVILCLVGAVAAFNHLWRSFGTKTPPLTPGKKRAKSWRWWSVPVCAGLGVLLANLIERNGSQGRAKAGLAAFVAGPAITMLTALVIVLVTCFIGVLLARS